MFAQQSMAAFAPVPLTVTLKNVGLWNEFSAITNEMIVSKPGRKLFPKLELDVKGLDPNGTFKIEVHFLRADAFRYKFDSASGSWVETGEEHEAEGSCGIFAQMHGPSRTGKELMEKKIELANFSLTNNPDMRKDNMVFLQSQHKYVPVVRVFQVLTGAHGEYSKTDIGNVALYEAQFIAVTCYQSDAIKKLKVAANPFARGSRSIHNTNDNRRDLESISRKRVVERVPKEEKPVKKGRKTATPTPSPSSSIPSQAYPSSVSPTISYPSFNPSHLSYPSSIPSNYPHSYNPYLGHTTSALAPNPSAYFPSYDPYDLSSYARPPSTSSSVSSNAYDNTPSNSFPTNSNPSSVYPSSSSSDPSSAFQSIASSILSPSPFPSTPIEPSPQPPTQNPIDSFDSFVPFAEIDTSNFFVLEDPDFEKYFENL